MIRRRSHYQKKSDNLNSLLLLEEGEEGSFDRLVKMDKFTFLEKLVGPMD